MNYDDTRKLVALKGLTSDILYTVMGSARTNERRVLISVGHARAIVGLGVSGEGVESIKGELSRGLRSEFISITVPEALSVVRSICGGIQ